jgi:hypothetical protein
MGAIARVELRPARKHRSSPQFCRRASSKKGLRCQDRRQRRP